MKAIATLLQDDPYMKLTPKQRCDKRRERKEKFFGQTIARVHDVVEVPVDKTERTELPIADIAPPDPGSLLADWVDRQRVIHKPLWFGTVDEIEPVKKKISFTEIQRACANRYGVTVRDIIGARRIMRIVMPRQIAMYLSKKHLARSLPEIGRRFGGKDHTTVLHAVKKIAARMAGDADFAEEVLALESEICA